MSQQDKHNSNKTNSRWPSGPQVSIGTLVSNGIFLLIFIALAIVMDNYIIPAIAGGIFAIVAVFRFMRGKSPVSLVAQGQDYSDTYTIQNGEVTVERDGKTWREPLSSYRGVLWYVVTTRRGDRSISKHRRRHTYQTVELRHSKDRDRDVNIYTSQELPGMRARWEEASRSFGLPALRDMGDGRILRREPEDFDKSLRDLAREGRLEPVFESLVSEQSEKRLGNVVEGQGVRSLLRPGPYTTHARWADAMNAYNPDFSRSVLSEDTPRPPGVRWKHMGDTLEIKVRKALLPGLLWALPIILFALFGAYIIPVDPLIKLRVIAVPWLLFLLWILIGFRIRITPQHVTVGTHLGPIPLWRRTIPLDEVEEVLIGEDVVGSAAVLVESDRASLRAGPLPDQSAQWLVHFLRQAIASAPEPDS